MCPLAERVVLTVATVCWQVQLHLLLCLLGAFFLGRIFSGPLHQPALLVCDTILQAETVVKSRNDRPWPVHVTSLRGQKGTGPIHTLYYLTSDQLAEFSPGWRGRVDVT
jgi:hypothetical protein